jgi:integrase
MRAKKIGDFLNPECDSASTNRNGGVLKRKCILERVGWRRHLIKHLTVFRKNMGALDYVRSFNRLNCPITLNPQEATFDDVGLHAYLRQRLSISTVEKNLRYARFMENHPVAPVDFRNPNYDNFIRHMDYREQIEGATPNALKHEWDTMRMFLRAYGIPRWDYKLPPIPKSRKRILPYPDTVNKFFNYKYSKDSYVNALYQYIFFHSFLIGWRPPSEIVSMTIDNVIIESGRGSIVIVEPKLHNPQRTLIPEKAIMTSKVHKSFKNWIDHWRPKVENQYSGNALYLWPSGKPVTAKIGQKLSEYGKKIWRYFTPYDMRHWCAIARLIKTKVETGSYDAYSVRNWLGHEKITSTESYIRYAEQYCRQLPVDWIARALKSQNGRGKHEHVINVARKINRTQFLALLTDFSPVELDGPGRFQRVQQERILQIVCRFSLNLTFGSFLTQIFFLFFHEV